jgi:perosamine synthetase
MKLGQLLSDKIRDKNIVLPHENQEAKYNWYLYTMAFNESRDKVKKFLNEHGIGATVYYDPAVHQTPYYSKFHKGELEITEWASKSVLSLPVHPSVTENDLDMMASTVEKAIRS